jgi:hypothetical protein
MNRKFYPLAYPGEEQDGAGDSALSSIDSAIEVINVQAIDTALQQTHTRRIGGANSIQNQNSILEAFNRYMPNSNIGVSQVSRPSFGGTTAFAPGGNAYGQNVNPSFGFSFDSESVFPLDLRLSELRGYVGVLNSPASGIFAGGEGLAGMSRLIDIVKFALPSILRGSATLSQPLTGVVGVGTALVGYFMGGRNLAVGTVRSIEKYSHSLDRCDLVSSQLTTGRSAPHSGLSSRTEGVVLGGVVMSSATLSYTPITSIEVINFLTDQVVAIGASLTHPHYSHAAFGTRTSGYLCGGLLSPSSIRTDLISKYSYSNRTVSPLSIRLQEAKVCCDGTGSGRAGYVLGGSAINWLGSASIDKLQYDPEIVSRLGSQLARPIVDKGVACDFNP